MSTESGATEAEARQALNDKGVDVEPAMTAPLSDTTSHNPEGTVNEAFSEPSVELPSSDMAAGTRRRVRPVSSTVPGAFAVTGPESHLYNNRDDYSNVLSLSSSDDENLVSARLVSGREVGALHEQVQQQGQQLQRVVAERNNTITAQVVAQDNAEDISTDSVKRSICGTRTMKLIVGTVVIVLLLVLGIVLGIMLPSSPDTPQKLTSLITSVDENVLDLSGSHLTGTIPSEAIALLTNLESLNLCNSVLEGTIPSEIALMTSLEALYMYNNGLEGRIPSEIGLMTRLKWVFLYENSLTGTIPTEVATLTSLASLSLHSNELTGSIQPISALTDLTELWLGNNNLTGTAIPSEIALLSRLTLMHVQKSGLTGTIPSEIALLSDLSWLRLDGNRLTGMIPSEIASMAGLEHLSIQNNNFSGEFTCPDFIRKCFISCYSPDNPDCRTL